ncbi:pentatricopeptide repeat-containing protein At1g74630 [Nymphaea colorata]|uniref:pentatricopeptide repeat-containing protein At1g74630 n=1 Tax=Nymphaea colorata TaxID=210225 RepID=UPI00129E4CFE|nr:pentatricopeptide repeat-containing protein At1g74630 [Nymphaea colorata]XP_049931973.1 pentatricopeptide repeat-containing protein At1g74630 [Nymphaea colorata]XP_049931974.1 pentatricopeptide repeat-containing protein At1g74630 [Nymphaea colorata]
MSELRCVSLLEKCRSLNCLLQIHGYAIKTGCDTDPFVLSKFLLFSAITFSDTMDYACLLFRSIPQPDGFMFNTLIRGFSESNMPYQSISTYAQMQKQGVKPDSFTFAFLLKSLINCGSLNTSRQVHCHAMKHGLDPHIFVRTSLITAYAAGGSIVCARQVFDEMRVPNVVSYNAMLSACLRCSEVDEARRIFDQMPWLNVTSWNIVLSGYMDANELELASRLFHDIPQKDLVSWNTMIIGCVQGGKLKLAFELFEEMRLEGFSPNEVSITGVLSACSQMGALEFGKMIHGYIDKAGFSHIVTVNNALVDLYGKCGNINMASHVFDKIMNKGVISWTVMIEVLAMHGHGVEAVELFYKMVESGIEPDGVTFVAILYACSHAGLTQKGIELFNMMKDCYHIEASMEHYGCMVDLYGRAGFLDCAYEFIAHMPIKPNAVIWRTLLGACSIHGDVILAEHVKNKLSEIDPENSSDYILLSNIYAIAGKWRDVAVVRKSMAERKMRKTPGWSMIEVDKVVFSFVAGDKRNPVAEVAYEKLSEIINRLRSEGYVADIGPVLHDIETEDKEDSVSHHSEKLAIAFGMARLHPESVIRIVKNLRVCRDCHTMLKFVSRVYGREIVVRDRSRFHVFKEGSCCCRDYW